MPSRAESAGRPALPRDRWRPRALACGLAARALLSAAAAAVLWVSGQASGDPARGREPLWPQAPEGERRARIERLVLEPARDLPDEARERRLEEMAGSSFAFLRGSAALFHRDLEASRAFERQAAVKALPAIVIQGDAHALNVGAFEDGDGRLIFDLNDFDEARVGDFRADLWRVAVSLRLLAQELGALKSESVDAAVGALAQSYLEQLLAFADGDDEASFRLDAQSARGPARRLILEAREEEGREAMLREWTRGRGEKRRFRAGSKIARVAPETERALRSALASSAFADRFEADSLSVLAVARRLRAGLGSLGVDRFYVLIEGPGPGGLDDVILDFKAQPELPRAPGSASPLAGSPGCRVSRAEELLLAAGDPYLGCLSFGGQSFSVRQRNPLKKSMKARKLEGSGDLASLGREIGRVLAAAHARGAASFDDSAAALFSGSGAAAAARRTFSREVLEFSAAYARQVERDLEILRGALPR
ncbi:MAG: DUF2252 family protein [Acidobacteriota bacterium]